MKSESGQLTLDFLFATVLVLGTAALVSALCIGLTLAEVLQYVAFSGSRAYLASDHNEREQVQAADQQVRTLLGNLSFLNGAIKSNWISVQLGGAGNYQNYAENKGASSQSFPDKFQFIGYQLTVKFSLLTFKFPIFGELVQPPSGAESIKGTLGSYMMREPTSFECRALMKQAYRVILSKYTQSPQDSAASYAEMVDNGC